MSMLYLPCIEDKIFPPPQCSIFKKITTKNIFNFRHNYNVTSHFGDDKSGKSYDLTFRQIE